MIIMFKNINLKHQPEYFNGRREGLRACRRGKPTEKKDASRHKLYTLEMRIQIPTPQQKSFMNPQSQECEFLPRRYYYLPGSGICYEENYLKCWELQKNLNNKNPCSPPKGYRGTVACRQPLHLEVCKEQLDSWGGSDKQSQRYQTCSFPHIKTPPAIPTH